MRFLSVLAGLVLLVLLAGFVSPGSHPVSAGATKKGPTFAKEGIAFLKAHCLRCHNQAKKGGVSLHTFTTEAALLRDRKLWRRVVNAVHWGQMPPATQKRPRASDIATFLAAVQGVIDRADRNAVPDPGRVTIRRLNRAEYNNTIRDLVGIDFDPTEDFPADDVGGGFDNNGDVLTLPPVLMERYLDAAERITTYAMPSTLPRVQQRGSRARYLAPPLNRDVKWRELSAPGNVLHATYKVALDGEFMFRVRCWARQTDEQPVKVALLLGTREIRTFEVTAPEGKPATLEVKLQLPTGAHRFSIKLLNPSLEKEKEGRNLLVESFQLIGPSDTRSQIHRQLMAVTPGKSQAEQTREILERFASRAYRRPATKEEVERLSKLVEVAQKRNHTWESAIRLAMQAVLSSPKFLFRVELDDRPTEARAHPIDEYQLASRLSYFLWATMPDQELFDLAAKKQLARNLDAQVKRMLKDQRAITTLTGNFALQWLQLGRLQVVSPDPKLFPTFTEKLRSAMLQETELFFAEIVREDHSIHDLIDGRFTYLNGLLAKHYGVEEWKIERWEKRPSKPGSRRFVGEKFVRIVLGNDSDLGGVLMQASVLTVTSNPTRTSPVKRGRWVLEQILGTPPPPPPPNVPNLPEDRRSVRNASLRVRMERHRKDPACASCHARMDAIGFAFENYDAIGRWRGKEGTFIIDASGKLPDGQSFKGPIQLKQILRARKSLFARNLTEKLLTYALGRSVEPHDKEAVDTIVRALARKGYRFSALVTEITKSYPFRMRRGTKRNP
jgi:hypothetical protein